MINAYRIEAAPPYAVEGMPGVAGFLADEAAPGRVRWMAVAWPWVVPSRRWTGRKRAMYAVRTAAVVAVAPVGCVEASS